MTVPGVGPVVALTYRVTVDASPHRDMAPGPYPLASENPSQSVQFLDSPAPSINRARTIEMMRMMLYEAAQILLVRSTKWSWLKARAMKIARHRGMKKAITALARRLAVIMASHLG